MHICFIEDTKLHGGTQLWVNDAIMYFLKKNWKVTLITPENGWLAQNYEKERILTSLITYEYSEITSEDDFFVNLWSQALSKCEIAICTVHPPRNDFHCSMFTAKCIIKSNLQTILITKTGTIVSSYLREYYLPSHLKNSKIITISETINKYLREKYKFSIDLIRNIYQGIDLEYFKSDENKNKYTNFYQNHEQLPLIGCIGYLEKRKGQIFLLQAISKLKLKLPNIFLLIVGDGPDKDLLMKKVNNLGLQHSVSFIPFTRDPLKYFSKLNLLVLPSLSKEGIPNVILEAFALKIPVIASDIGGISEIVRNGETGFLVRPKKVNQLVNAIVSIWEDKKRYELMKENTYELIREEHDRKKQLMKFERYFLDLLGK